MEFDTKTTMYDESGNEFIDCGGYVCGGFGGCGDFPMLADSGAW